MGPYKVAFITNIHHTNIKKTKPVWECQNVGWTPVSVTSASDHVPQTSDHVKHGDTHDKALLWFGCGLMCLVSI